MSRFWQSVLLGLFLVFLANRVVAGLAVDASSREQSRLFFNAVYYASENIPPTWTGNIDTCDPGTTAQAYRDATALRINLYRAFAGAPAGILFDADFNSKAQQAALMMSANNALSHTPPSSWACYSAAGAQAAGNSNLSLGVSGPDAVNGQMRDDGDNNTAVGHRRWLLYPQTQKMGTGDVPASPNKPAANAIWVQDGSFGSTRPATRDDFVAWPPRGFIPHRLVFPRWSFSYPGADFTAATVLVQREGQTVPVKLETIDSRFGENTLVWRPTDALLADSSAELAADTTYSVEIGNVFINGVAKKFTYAATLFEPKSYGPDTKLPQIAGPDKPVVGQDNTYTFTPLVGVDGYDWLQARHLPSAFSNGAEMGLDGFIANVSDVATVISGSSKHTGSASFHLHHKNPGDQMLTLDKDLLAGPNTELSFFSRLAYSTADETALVQISTDGGNSWFDLYRQSGISNQAESAFTQKRIPLANYTGRLLRIRFNYHYSSGTFYNDPLDAIGWFIDDILLTGFDELQDKTINPTPNAQGFNFKPNGTGDYALLVRGKWNGQYPTEWGGAKTVSAVTQAPSGSFMLSLAKTGSGQGVISSTTAGIGCDISCTNHIVNLPTGTVLKLSATVNSGSIFGGWTGDCSGMGDCTLTLDKNKTVSAIFNLASPARFMLTISKSGSGTGVITSSPAGIDCGSACSQDFSANTLLTLTAQAGNDSVFAGWGGACSGSGTCQVSLDQAKTVIATFNKAQAKLNYLLALNKMGTGQGTVISAPLGINCGRNCSKIFKPGQIVKLIVKPANTSVFSGWSGDCSGVGNCLLTMNQDHAATANFSVKTYPLIVTRIGNGSIVSNVPGIDCGSHCTQNYPTGTRVTLTAQAQNAAIFTGWQGDCRGRAKTCTLNMNRKHSVTATFK